MTKAQQIMKKKAFIKSEMDRQLSMHSACLCRDNVAEDPGQEWAWRGRRKKPKRTT